MSTLVIVDENDRFLREVARDDFDPSTDIYRVSALWVTNSKGEILLAQRGLTDSNEPGKWGPAAAGTVNKGESYFQNIVKEASEELGLNGIRINKGPKIFINGGINFFCQWYGAVIDKPAEDFVIQEEEVQQVAWIDLQILNQELQANPEKYISSMPNVPNLYLQPNKLNSFTYSGAEHKVRFLEELKVKKGVVCDVYGFVNDDSQDLGVITVESGAKTPVQKVLKGQITLEGYLEGAGRLVVKSIDSKKRAYNFPEDFEINPVEVKVGELMQWHASQDEQLVIYEICKPPYSEGRFENLNGEI